MRLLRFARNDGISGILDGILNEIAPSALLPRNDRIPAMTQGILEFPRAEIPQRGWGMTGNSRIP